MTEVTVWRDDRNNCYSFTCPNLLGIEQDVLDEQGEPIRVYNHDEARQVFEALKSAP